MIGTSLSHRGTRVRHVTVGDDLEVTVAESNSAYFPCRLFAATDPGDKSDGSPRESAAKQRLVWNAAGAPELHAADRVEVYGGNGTFELLTTPEALRTGQRVSGFQVEVLNVDALYPLSAEFEGVSSAEPAPISLFTGSEDVRDHGAYETYEAECPVEFADQITDNTVLEVGDSRFRVLSSIVDYQVPHVRLSLRRG